MFSSGPKGTAAVLVVGGAREVLNQPDPSQGNGEIRLILKERKGFVKGPAINDVPALRGV